MNWLEGTYYLYLILSMGVVSKVGLVLYKNGYFFLYHAFKNVEMASSINKLLLLGYFLSNTAFVLFYMQIDEELTSIHQLFLSLAWKLGIITGSLGLMHHFNIVVIAFLSKFFLVSAESK